MRHLLTCSVSLALIMTLRAESPAKDDVSVLSDIAYKSGAALSDYEKQRCKLDVYLPKGAKNFPTLVWFHGGGLKNGDKAGTREDTARTPQIARSFAMGGVAVVAVNYRLSPGAAFPAYIEDAAAAVAWTRAHIGEHGGDAKKLFVGGHSAGGYLTLMLGMDTHFLKDAGMKPGDIAGYIPVSGQVMTHYTVLAERGLGRFSIMADSAAPVHFARKDTQPFLVLYADHDMGARAEENIYFVSLMKLAENTGVTGHLISDRTHGSIASKMVEENDLGRLEILKFIQSKSAER